MKAQFLFCKLFLVRDFEYHRQGSTLFFLHSLLGLTRSSQHVHRLIKIWQFSEEFRVIISSYGPGLPDLLSYRFVFPYGFFLPVTQDS